MWVLFLNDMRASNIENYQPRFRAPTREALIAFLARELVPAYQDAQWCKTYRAGGPLEWCNPPFSSEESANFQYVGTLEDWMESAARNYEMKVMILPEVSS